LPPGTETFTRDSRLLQAKEFANVFAARQRLQSGPLQVYVAANGRPRARLGLAISRRATGTAVVRNRLKRLAREVFRHQQDSLAGLDIVVSVNQPIPVTAQQTFADNLKRLLVRARACASSSNS
jgi:ribonuclease P protein component